MGFICNLRIAKLIFVLANLFCVLSEAQFQQGAFWKRRPSAPMTWFGGVPGISVNEDPGSNIWSNPVTFPSGTLLVAVAIFNSNTGSIDMKNSGGGSWTEIFTNNSLGLRTGMYLRNLTFTAIPGDLQVECDGCPNNTHGSIYYYAVTGATAVDNTSVQFFNTPGAMSDTLIDNAIQTTNNSFYIVTQISVPSATRAAPAGAFLAGAAVNNILSFSTNGLAGQYEVFSSGQAVQWGLGLFPGVRLDYSAPQNNPRLIYLVTFK
jgi:hypothetical protein